MAGRKGATVQLQHEINTEEEWDQLIQKTGLIVVDVYSGWCGPCLGMVGNLKKIKLDVGGDMLILAIAKSDDIACLERFRNKSEPTWLFISGGKIVTIMFGANAPQLMRMITEELQLETESQKGLRERVGIDFHELTPEEEERLEIEKKNQEALLAIKEAAEKRAQEKKYKMMVKKLISLLKNETVVLFLPFLYDDLLQIWPPYKALMEALGEMFEEKAEALVSLSLEDAQQLMNIYEEEHLDDLKEQLERGKCIAKMIGIVQPEPEENEEENEGKETKDDAPVEISDTAVTLLEEGQEETEEHVQEEIDVKLQVLNIIYGCNPNEVELPEGQTTGLLAQVSSEFSEVTLVPGIWSPATDEQKASAALMLFPSYVEEVLGPEPEPLPPHVVVVYDIAIYPKLGETLIEHEKEVLKSGFFDNGDPSKAKQIAATHKDFEQIPTKTGNEKYVVVLDNTKNDALLSFAQFTPTYISQNVEDGKEDCEKFFPPFEEDDDEVDSNVNAIKFKFSIMGAIRNMQLLEKEGKYTKFLVMHFGMSVYI